MASTEVLGFLSLPAVTSGTLGLDLSGAYGTICEFPKFHGSLPDVNHGPVAGRLVTKLLFVAKQTRVKDSRAVYLANGFEFNSLTRLNSFYVN